MRIDINKIPFSEGFDINETWDAKDFDLDTEHLYFVSPIDLYVHAQKGYDFVGLSVRAQGKVRLICARCLKEYETELEKNFNLNYPLDKNQLLIEPDNNIREELILEYPLKPLCNPDCKGICQKCGEDLNSGKCKCQ